MVVFPVFGQFANLALTDDGGEIYFSTRLRLRESQDLSWPKVYRLDGAGFHLAGQGTEYPGTKVETGGWMVESASVSGDGSVVAVNSRFECRFGSPCVGIAQEFTEIRTRLGVRHLVGLAEVSRGGRYVAIRRETGFGIFPPPELERERGVNVLDLATGMRSPAGALPARTGRWISSDGTVLVAGWALVGPDGTRVSLGAPPVTEVYRAVLAPDASFVVYQVGAETSELRIRERGGTDRLLAAEGAWPSVGVDGRVLYLAPAAGNLQMFVDGRQVSSEVDGVVEAALSGMTGVAAGVTGSGQLITLDVRNGFRTEYVGRSPKLAAFPRTVLGESTPEYPAEAPGSVYSLTGEHLVASGADVLVNGRAATVLSAGAEAITYQVDWDTPLSETGGEVVLRSGDSVFEAVVTPRRVAAVAPAFLALGSEPFGPNPSFDRMLFAVHGDWRGLVRDGDPARYGEYVHLYATGLGPVTPRVATGAVSPDVPLARASIACQWNLNGGPRPAEVLFAGLAPGLIGYYQLTVRVPAEGPEMKDIWGLVCGEVAGVGIDVSGE